MKRAVVTSSSSCLEALGLSQGMDILRLHVNINNVDFIDGKNITKKLSAPAAFVANLFDIKPIMQINQIGEIIAVEKVRKLEKTLITMGKTVEKLAANQPAFIYLTDTGHHESTEFFKKLLATYFGWHDLPVIRVSTISLANHGLMGTGIGVFYGELPHIVKALKK